MNKLPDKLILFALCLTVYLMHESGAYIVVPVIFAVFASAATAYFYSIKAKGVCFAIYITACFAAPALLLFLPVLCYDMTLERRKYLFAVSLPIVTAFFCGYNYIGVFSLILIVVGMLMSYRTETIEKSKREYISLQDSARESLMKLEDKNRELLQRQDYEINLATLSERNRIARDIHDSVGHQLSRAILQVGAIMATCHDAKTKQGLESVKDTLSQGMDSIRVSVHGLYDQSIDLYAEVRGIVESYKFCPVTLDYDVDGSPDKKIKYAFIAIIKEALTNTARHSKATAVSIKLREQPAFYSLAISDNGRGVKKEREPEGIGLKNIADRVEDIGGILNINGEKGFKIYISVPKGVKENENCYSG